MVTTVAMIPGTWPDFWSGQIALSIGLVEVPKMSLSFFCNYPTLRMARGQFGTLHHLQQPGVAYGPKSHSSSQEYQRAIPFLLNMPCMSLGDSLYRERIIRRLIKPAFGLLSVSGETQKDCSSSQNLAHQLHV